uniref:hypothetical protein n=1 Tax=Flavobacterium sp. TaxID=239 RepID=UPI004049EE8A
MKKLFFLFFLLNFFYSFSCSCEYTEGLSSIKIQSSDYIFTGEIVNVERIKLETNDGFYFKLKTTFKIIKDYKFQLNEIVIFTEEQESACGLPIKKIGDKWLIFGYLNKGQIETDLCTKSVRFNNIRFKDYESILEYYYDTEGDYELFDDKQRIIEIGSINKGKPFGIWLFYNYDFRYGKYLEKEIKYEEAVVSSVLTYYNPTRIVFNDKDINYKEIVVEEEFGIQNKRLLSKKLFVKNTIEIYTYYENGTLSSKTKFIDNKKEGVFCYYYENGFPSFIYSFKEGIKTNHYLSFYDNGNIKIQGFFKDNKPVGEWKAFTKDGSIALVCNDKIPKYHSKDCTFICPLN